METPPQHKADILVVDDNLPNLRLLVKLLMEHDFRVRSAVNGEMALQAIQLAPPDLILLDINMPNMSGYELCQILKENPQTAPIPIIFVSALDTVFDKVVAFSVGAVDYITKPFQMEEVLARVETHLTIQHLQRQLQKANNELENRVAERTTELAQANSALYQEIQERERSEKNRAELEKQLYQAQKMEALGRLAGGIAHDFNNLLTVIIGYVDLLMMNPEISETKFQPDVEQILLAGQRARNLTRQLLAFSRRRVLNLELLNLNDIVTDMKAMFRRVIESNIELNARCNPKLGLVKADRGQLEQVLMNLVVNARDAMPNGGRLTIETNNVYIDEIYIEHRNHLLSGDYVMLAVRDTGIGMDAETQAQIFEPFFTTKTADRGTGLGLSTVHGIVKQSKGDIWVYSELGKGTVFKVYLPQTKTQEKKIENILAVPTIAHNNAKTILVVEDDDAVRLVVNKLLEQHGFNVLVAHHATEAINICATTDVVDLLMTDVVMPEMSGRQLAKQIHQSYPDLKLLYMSGYTGDRVLQSEILQPHIGFIEKPFTKNDLIAKIYKLLLAT